MENASPNYLGRYRQLTQTIQELLALPPPPPAEKHLLREQILELELWRLETIQHMSDQEMMQIAVERTLEQVPQYLYSYPMRLREVTMPSIVGCINEYPKVPGSLPQASEVLEERLNAVLTRIRTLDR